ncbi:hypothetical protein ACSS7Z_07385 [Microbacterium sp. A82]|uniref:hypothetical protein n=1 Tax=unclassified Microbacterium TaxID=2609290 RepID=UPI003F40C487
MTTLSRTVTTATGYDTRDEPHGRFIGMGLVFRLVGTSGHIVWSINTGWALSPMTNPTMVPGPQSRSSRPGIDHALATRFPEPLGALLAPAGGDHRTDSIDVGLDPQDLLRTLLTRGDTAVFDELESAYRAAFPNETDG